MDLDFSVAFQEEQPQPAREAEIVPPRAVPPPPAKLDIRPVALSLMPFEEICRAMLQAGQALSVTDDDSYKAAVSQVSENKRLIKELDLSYKGFVTPYNNHVTAIRNLFKRLTDYLKRNDEILRQKMTAHLQKQKLERQRKEAEQREANRRLQEQLDAEAAAQKEAAANIIQTAQEKLEQETDPGARATLERTIAEETAVLEIAAPIVPPVAIEQASITRVAEGAAYTKDKWKVRIIDPDKVPREYCDPSMKKLNAAVKGGARHIDGCEIYEDLELNVKV